MPNMTERVPNCRRNLQDAACAHRNQTKRGAEQGQFRIELDTWHFCSDNKFVNTVLTGTFALPQATRKYRVNTHPLLGIVQHCLPLAAVLAEKDRKKRVQSTIDSVPAKGVAQGIRAHGDFATDPRVSGSKRVGRAVGRFRAQERFHASGA
jgi:hypothetical protein